MGFFFLDTIGNTSHRWKLEISRKRGSCVMRVGMSTTNQISGAAALIHAEFHPLTRICPREKPPGLSRTELC